MPREHLYLVAYDIADQKRWRKIFRLMKGYGEWLQLSVFQCRLTQKQHAEMIYLMDEIIHHDHDHIIIMNMGPADKIKPKVVSLGQTFTTIEREPKIV